MASTSRHPKTGVSVPLFLSQTQVNVLFLWILPLAPLLLRTAPHRRVWSPVQSRLTNHAQPLWPRHASIATYSILLTPQAHNLASLLYPPLRHSRMNMASLPDVPRPEWPPLSSCCKRRYRSLFCWSPSNHSYSKLVLIVGSVILFNPD